MSQTPIQPSSNYILGIQEKTPNKTKSGFLLPDSAQKRISITTVIAVGKDVENYKEGDRIIYKDYTQNEFKFDDVEYLLIEENDILATVKGA